jgi:hypothetical protein
MSTLTGVSYSDFLSRLGPDNKISGIINLLMKTNDIMTDYQSVECNKLTSHQTTVVNGLPTATWRILNYGVAPTKGVTSKIEDSTGMLEAYSEVDKDMADLNGNAPAWRLSEARLHLEGMNQQMATTMIYGSQLTYPERFTGFSPRYAALGTDPDTSTYNCVNAYGSAAGADQTSMYLVCWGENTVHGLHPKGSEAGLKHEDKGQVTLDQPAGYHYEGYRDHFQWKLGLTVRDWHYVVRICNIDTSAITTSVVDLFAAMIDAYYRIPHMGMGTAVFYANATVLAWLWKQYTAKTNVGLTVDQTMGKPVLNFQGIPIRRCDAILNTESIVT